MSQGAIWPIFVKEHAQFVLNVTLRDYAGVIRDLTGGGARFEIRLTQSPSATLILTADLDDARLSLGGTDGTIYVRIPMSVVDAAAAWTEGYFDLFFFPVLTDETLQPECVLQGNAVFDAAVTDNEDD